MKTSVSIAELKVMSPKQRERRIDQLVEATRQPSNGEVKSIDERLAQFESKFGFKSDQLEAKLASGEISETEEICHWLSLLTIRARLADITARPR